MENNEINFVKDYMTDQIMKLSLKSYVIKKACSTFNISKSEALFIFQEARRNVKKKALNQGFIYLLLGSLSFGVSLFGSMANTGIIMYGGLLAGSGMLITSVGYFRIALRTQ